MIRTRYGISPWIDQFLKSRRPEYPRLRESSTIAVVIVGGGLAGCCTAYALATSGVKVALLEADRIGSGGSSRSPGVLQGEAAPSFREIESRHGLRAARAMFDASRRAVLELAATVRRLAIKGDVETYDAIRIVPPYGSHEKTLARETAARREAGLEAVWQKRAAAVRESRVEGAVAGVKFHDWGRADPYRLTVGFASAAVERGAQIFERTAARRIKVKRKHVEVHTAGGVITAQTVIVCSGEPTDLFRSLKRHVRPVERYAVVTERLPAAVRRQVLSHDRIVTDTDTPPHVVRWTSDDRLIIAGADQSRTPARGREKVLVQRSGQLMYELLRLYPAISGIRPEYGWDMPVGTTHDGAMYAGPHRNYPRHLFAWATRHDPAQAFLASRILLRHVLDESDREDAYFAFTRG